MVNSYIDNKYKQEVPANIRILVKSLFNPSNINEHNFTTNELDALRDAYINSQTHMPHNNIQYDDYAYSGNYRNKNPYASLVDMLKNSKHDRGFAMANTLGRANYQKDKNGNIHILDMYNFPKFNRTRGRAVGQGPAFGILHNMAERYAHPMGVDINIGNSNNNFGYGR